MWYLKEQLDAEEIPAPPKEKPNIALIGCSGQAASGRTRERTGKGGNIDLGILS